MNEKVKRVMEHIHGIAYRELQGDQYIEFLECIEYEIDKELEEATGQNLKTTSDKQSK